MPVSTRSQVSSHSQTEPNPSHKTRARFVQEEANLRNPHHGLKEKMKALTLLYEQHKQAYKNPNMRFQDGEEDDGNVRGKNQLKSNSTVTRNFIMPTRVPNEDSKENFVADGRASNVEKIMGFSCQRKEGEEVGKVARKLAMGTGFNAPQSEPRGIGGYRNLQEVNVADCGGGSSASGSRIQVFVRLRPMGKKEKEAGSRCCVRVVNGRDVYLTEFAAEHDYLRLKRVRGRHFAFDASFPDSTGQNEVYSTT